MDAFFRPSTQTSDNVYSDILPPLEHIPTRPPTLAIDWSPVFGRIHTELTLGFNVLCYGAGSKHATLNAFAKHASKHGHVLVVNAFNPLFTFRHLLDAIEAHSSLYLIIHNIDAPAFHRPSIQRKLASLVASPDIHLLASVDNIAWPTQWGNSSLQWIYHDLTTLAPYHAELSSVDLTQLPSANTAKVRGVAGTLGGPGTQGGQIIQVTESAARHILLSVTQKAKKLFVLLGTKQLEAMSPSSPVKPTAKAHSQTGEPLTQSLAYTLLFSLARQEFIATSDTSLRALMAEFKDHGLMVTVALAQKEAEGGGQALGGGTEGVWIPMRRDSLAGIIAELKAQGI